MNEKTVHTNPNSFPLGVLSRALVILEQISLSPVPLGISDVARTSGLPKSTVHRLLALLLADDFVQREGRGYILGSGIIRLARQLPRVPDDLRRTVMPYLIELHERTGDVVTLGVLDRAEVAVVEQLRGHRQAHLPQSRFRVPAHCSAIGKLLLAAGQDGLPEFLDRSDLPACTPRSLVQPDLLAADLAEVRRRGYAISRQEEMLGVVDIALPIIGPDGPLAGVARSRAVGSAGFDGRDIALHRSIALSASAAFLAGLRPAPTPRQPEPD